jgi:hypothetical protein
MRWRNALLTGSSALLLGGCGGAEPAPAPPPAPRIPVGVASRLAAEADRVAELAPGTCAARDAAARFRADVVASISSVPARYQEPLTSAVNDLAERLAACDEGRGEDGADNHARKDRDHGKEDGKKRGGGKKQGHGRD